MGDPLTAARLAHRWLIAVAVETPDQSAYQELGLGLCECIEAGTALNTPPEQGAFLGLPAPDALVALDRSSLLELSRSYSAQSAEDDDRDLTVAQLALSYARVDDLQTVAALLRLGAGTIAGRTVAADAWDYLFAQQQPDGSFGLMSPELALLNQPETSLTPRLAMTVEVLWALAATSRPQPGGVLSGA